MPTTLHHSLKLLATHCTTTTATHSPTASPVFRRRRRKTLRMLLLHDPPESADNHVRVRSRLKDLLLSSPPLPPPITKRQDRGSLLPSASAAIGFRSRTGSRLLRGNAAAGSVSFRRRLLRRAWRPVLLSIPE
ncbi:hypothetical protein PHAVU_004G066700 [Phaseolus vulgaris]|uniref:Uncharacterized protein n=1 Tax=Phaseolus vulgaris TaxID=3885 RepID=V7C459_PHAVU|nr:hypothetical protein PHAVU_004G066700g [Phaseolus vulgaris]ESW23671.1 hypothetical protein PHAVU_004G066700g [Phaseolus vulgaris]